MLVNALINHVLMLLFAQYLQVWTQWSHLQTRVWTLWALSQLLALYTAGDVSAEQTEDKIEAKIESPQKIETVETMAERTVS